MKVNGVGGPSATPASRPAARSGAGFSLSGSSSAAGAQAASTASSASSVAGVSALMALQGVEDPTEKRRRSIRRASGLLDRLDEVKLALLGGADGASALDRLSRNLAEERPDDSDEGLKSVLDQIDLRAAVELAKSEMAKVQTLKRR